MRITHLTEERDRRASAAWDAYVAAKRRADDTMCIADGIAAGKAWRTFLTVFQSAEQNESDRALDVRLARRARA